MDLTFTTTTGLRTARFNHLQAQNASQFQVCVDPRTSDLNMMLPAAALCCRSYWSISAARAQAAAS